MGSILIDTRTWAEIRKSDLLLADPRREDLRVGIILYPSDSNSSAQGGHSLYDGYWAGRSERWTQVPSWSATDTPVVPPPPPPRKFARGPKSSNIGLWANGSTVLTTSSSAGVAFGLYGYAPTTGCSSYWEFVCGTAASTLGGFGVGGVLTAISSEPGKGTNPGAMLYYESGAYTLWNNGASTTLTGPASPTRFGVSVTATAPNTLTIRFFVDGTDVSSAVTWTFQGSMWVPCICTKANAMSVMLEDAA